MMINAIQRNIIQILYKDQRNVDKIEKRVPSGEDGRRGIGFVFWRGGRSSHVPDFTEWRKYDDFNSEIYAHCRKEEGERDAFIENPFVVEEGALECAACGSRRVFSQQIQTRSLDEPSTTFAQCAACRKSWKYSG